MTTAAEDSAPGAKAGIYTNIAAPFHQGRAVSAALGGTLSVIVAMLHAPYVGAVIAPVVVFVAWDSFRQIDRPRASPVGFLLTDWILLIVALMLLRPPLVVVVGPIAVMITAGMLLLPWHRTLAVLGLGGLALIASSLVPSPVALDLPAETVSVLAPFMALAYLPNFVLLLRGANQVLADRQALTAELERRLAYEHALVRCSQALLALRSDASLSAALESLRAASNVDAIVVARNAHDDQGRLTREIVTVINRLERAPYVVADREFLWDDIPHVRDALKAGRTYFYARGELPDAESRVFEEAGIESDLVIPIGVNGVWAGYISFTDCSGSARWSVYDHELLPSVARMIGAHWTRLDNARRLEAMIEQKDEFVASVSHELRTPLTAVVGFAQELRDRYEDVPEQERQELIELISGQSLEVAHIVEDLLVVARLGSDSLTLAPERLSMLDQADQVVRALGMDGAVTYRGDRAVMAMADSGRYRQVVRNLLTNARRYGGDSVVLEVGSGSDHAFIVVRDDGPGVPQERWELIFEPYERTQSRSTPGSVGLGLTVSRQLCRLMGGDLTYRYRGGWSEFTVQVPPAAGVLAHSA